MISTAPSLHALWRRVLAAGAVLTLAASLLIGMADVASAASTRTWTFSAVTFSDGGQMTGSFGLDVSTGELSAVHITTAGGDMNAFGSSTTYDASNVDPHSYYDGEWVYIITNDRSRQLEFRPPGMADAADGDAIPLATDSSSEWMISGDAWRQVTAGSVIAGPASEPPAVAGAPTITLPDTGAPRVGQILTGDDSAVSATPQGATKSYQWLRDGAPIPAATGTTYTLINDDAGHVIAFQVGATEAGYPDATPAISEPVGPVTGPARRLAVTAPGWLYLAGRGVRVTTVGLEANEPYVITIGGIQVAIGHATDTGALSRLVTVPASTGERAATVTVTGSEPDRTGTMTIRVVVRKTLGLHLAKPVMHKRHRQWVTVRGLAAGEHVRVAYRGKRISPAKAHANANGVYRVAVHVGRLAGTKTVTAAGAFYARRATATFRVTRH
jgi:hypothetical protein